MTTNSGPVPAAREPVLDIQRGDVDKASIAAIRAQARHCPLMRAAYRLADPAVIAAVVLWHPPQCCPAVRLERAA